MAIILITQNDLIEQNEGSAAARENEFLMIFSATPGVVKGVLGFVRRSSN